MESCRRTWGAAGKRTPPAARAPEWVRGVVEEKKGRHARLLMEKLLTRSDVDANQNRLLMPSGVQLRRALAEGEWADVVGAGKKDGLAVQVYTRARWGPFALRLTRWESTKSTVLNGHDWRVLRGLCGLRAGAKVQLWSFRADGCLCMVIGSCD